MPYISYEEFYGDTDWQQSSGPQVDRNYHLADLWPQIDTAPAAKDVLEDGLHPVFAIGGQTTADGRPENLTGVVKTYNATATMAVINIADGAVVRAYVSNILTYTPGVGPATFNGAPAIGDPVYVDDSDALGAGCTLSLSPLNDADPGLPNPLAGWLFYCQDEYADRNIGGPNATSDWPKTWDAETGSEYLVCVLLTNDSGQTCCDVVR